MVINGVARSCWVSGMSYLNNEDPTQSVPNKGNGAFLYGAEKWLAYMMVTSLDNHLLDTGAESSGDIG